MSSKDYTAQLPCKGPCKRALVPLSGWSLPVKSIDASVRYWRGFAEHLEIHRIYFLRSRNRNSLEAKPVAVVTVAWEQNGS